MKLPFLLLLPPLAADRCKDVPCVPGTCQLRALCVPTTGLCMYDNAHVDDMCEGAPPNTTGFCQDGKCVGRSHSPVPGRAPTRDQRVVLSSSMPSMFRLQSTRQLQLPVSRSTAETNCYSGCLSAAAAAVLCCCCCGGCCIALACPINCQGNNDNKGSCHGKCLSSNSNSSSSTMAPAAVYTTPTHHNCSWHLS